MASNEHDFDGDLRRIRLKRSSETCSKSWCIEMTVVDRVGLCTCTCVGMSERSFSILEAKKRENCCAILVVLSQVGNGFSFLTWNRPSIRWKS